MRLATIVFLVLSILFGVGTWWNVSKTSGIFYGDALGYHAYLPAAFIYGNLTHIQDMALDTTIDSGTTDGMKRWKDSYSVNQTGNVIIQYTYANALMNAPFFLLGHGVALVTHYPINGFSLPYLVSIKCAGIFYGLFGFWLLYLTLQAYFNRDDIVFGLTSIFIGSNVFWFMIIQSGMAHINIFFLYSLIIYASHRYYIQKKLKWIAVIGLAIGLLTVIRPTDIIAIMIPLFYGVSDRIAFQNRIRFLKNNLKSILPIGVFCMIIPVVPQVLYWYVMTGEFIFYSYQDQGFNWTHPEIIAGLFGPRNGWLTYSPLLAIPFVSIILIKKQYPLKWINWMIIPLYIYIAYAWWCYNYINGFGSRPMIHIYPLLAFALILALSSSKGVWRSILMVFIVCLSLVNVNYTLKAIDGRIVTDESTHAFNFATFFKNTINTNDLLLRDTEVWQPTLKSKALIQEVTIADSIKYNNCYDSIVGAFDIGSDLEYAPFSLEHIVSNTELLEYKYLSVGGDFMAPYLIYNLYNHHILTLSIKRGGGIVKWYGVKLNNKIGKTDQNKDVQIQTCVVGEWGDVYFTIPTEELKEGDLLKSVIWNPDKKQLMVRSFKMLFGN